MSIALGRNLLDVRNASKLFGTGASQFWAVRDVSLTVANNECVALVGESGSGKSTLARMILGLTSSSEGSVLFGGEDVAQLAATRAHRKRLAGAVQMVFQDPYSSLDPTMRIARIIAEPLEILGWRQSRISERVAEVLGLVGLDEAYAERRPRELSGGQRQRIGIARALGPEPQMLLLDEPVASLDVSIQGQILRLLKDIQAATGIAILVIAHDLGVVRAIADRTLVMYLGRIVERGPTAAVFDAPVHPYTAALLWSASAAGRQNMPADAKRALTGEALSAPERATGCVFRSRCWRTAERCRHEVERAGDATHEAWCNVPLSRPANLAAAS